MEESFRTSLAGRATVALVLFVGYYILAFAMAGFLLFIPYAEAKYTGRIHYIWVPIVCIAGAVLILWSIIPRRERFKEPGPRLTPESDPRLFAQISRAARELNQEAPQEVYLLPNVTAWVSERGGSMGLRSRRIAGVGLTLLQVLSINEFRAVLAHEFGHFSRGDTRLGPWIHKTRSAIERTLQGLQRHGTLLSGYDAVIRQPFVLYGNWFLRITQAISRRQEYLADEVSAMTAGRETVVSALRKTYMADMAYPMYWANELTRILNAGFLPPFAAGFGQGLELEPIKRPLMETVKEVEKLQSRPYDPHPSLGERIKALEALPAGREPGAARGAISLLEDVPKRERQLFALMNPELGPKLRPIAWEDVTAAVHIPFWADLAQKHQTDLAGVTPKNLSDKLHEAVKWGQQMSVTSGQVLTDDQAKFYAAYVVSVAIITKMIVRGWRAHCAVWQQVVISHGGRSWEPFVSVYALVGGAMTSDDWLVLCHEMGMADLELGSGGQAPKSGPHEAAVRPEPEGEPAERSPSPFVVAPKETVVKKPLRRKLLWAGITVSVAALVIFGVFGVRSAREKVSTPTTKSVQATGVKYFTKGSTKAEVLRIQGPPDIDSGLYWWYRASVVRFDVEGKVIDFSNNSKNLKAR